MYADIDDGQPRLVRYVTDVASEQILSRFESGSTAIKNYYYVFDGIRIGDVANFGEQTYKLTINDRWSPTNNQGNYADFDLSYSAVHANSMRSSGSAWTVQAGETLQSIAAAAWGDASLWWLIADANGLNGSETLVANQVLHLPAQVSNVHNNADTFKPYDPNRAIGSNLPNRKKLPKPGRFDGLIKIFVAAIALIVAAIMAPYAIAAVSTMMGTATTAAAVTTAMTTAGGFAAAGISTTAVVAGSAIAGAAGSIAGQGFAMATGAQSKFDWKAVGMAALTSAVTAGLGTIKALQPVQGAGHALGNTGRAIARGVGASVITQGVGVATGLQDEFDWAGVAVAGISSASGGLLHGTANALTSNVRLAGVLEGLAAGVVGAGARSLIEGSSFGDNLMAALPSVIGQTLGNLLIEGFKAVPAEAPAGEAETGGATLGLTADWDSEFNLFYGPDGASESRIVVTPPLAEGETTTVDPIVVTARKLSFWEKVHKGIEDWARNGASQNVFTQQMYTAAAAADSRGWSGLATTFRVVGWAKEEFDTRAATTIVGGLVETGRILYDGSPAGNLGATLENAGFEVPGWMPNANHNKPVVENLGKAVVFGARLYAGDQRAYGEIAATVDRTLIQPIREGDYETAARTVGGTGGVIFGTAVLAAAGPETWAGGTGATVRTVQTVSTAVAAERTAVALARVETTAAVAVVRTEQTAAAVARAEQATGGIVRAERAGATAVRAEQASITAAAAERAAIAQSQRVASASAARAAERPVAAPVGTERVASEAVEQAAEASVRSTSDIGGIGSNSGLYRVGPYNEIRGTVHGLDAHHVGQKALLGDMIPGYDPLTAPAILVPKVGHTIRGPNGIVSRNVEGLTTPRSVVARDIMELRRVYPDIPNAQLQELIRMNKAKYPGSFSKGQ